MTITAVDTVGNQSTATMTFSIRPLEPSLELVSFTSRTITVRDKQAYTGNVERQFVLNGVANDWTTDTQYTFTGLNPNAQNEIAVNVRKK
jgi:hypothetical protein